MERLQTDRLFRRRIAKRLAVQNNLDAGDIDDVPPTWTLEPTIVTGTVPSLSSSSGALSASRTVRATPASPPRHLVWVCGPVEANAIGGAQRSCEYL